MTKTTRVSFLVVSISLHHICQATCFPNIVQSTPDSSFTINGDGTATDNTTGLMWMRCSLGKTWDGTNCSGSYSYYNWRAALSTAEAYNFAGYNDWRIPNLKELDSIVETACYEPAINETIFPNPNAVITTDLVRYWSSSPHASDDSEAWGISFIFGYVNTKPKNNTYQVILVRAGS